MQAATYSKPITAPAPPRPAVAEAGVECNFCAGSRRRSESQGPDDQVPSRASRRRTRFRGARRLSGLVGQRHSRFRAWRPCSFRWLYGSGRTSRQPSCCRAAILIEQGVQFPHIPITEKIPLWQGIGPGHLEGADILLLIVLVVYFLKRDERGARWFPRTHVSVAMRAVLGCVALAIVVGQVHHGSLRVSLMEARPYVYLAATYFLTCVLVQDRRAIHAVLWGFVGSVAFKALQGIYVWIGNRHMVPKPRPTSVTRPRTSS